MTVMNHVGEMPREQTGQLVEEIDFLTQILQIDDLRLFRERGNRLFQVAEGNEPARRHEEV